MTRITTGNNGITQHYNSITHRGVDIGWHSKEEDNIVTAHSDGIVVDVVKNYNKTDSKGSSYGNYVKIKHLNGYYTLYAHLKYGTVGVVKNQSIKCGEKIAVIGNTGRSKGRHLHFEVRNKNNTRINPEKYINADLPNMNTLKTGKYILTKEKYVRTSPEVTPNNKVKYSHIAASLLSKFKKDNLGYAKYRIGASVDVTEIVTDSKGNIWGKTKNTYFCMKDSTGLQVKEI